MAWSSSAVPAAELTLLAADKPILVGKNIVTDAHWSTGGLWSSTASDPGFPYQAKRAYDRFAHAVTRPHLYASSDVWYLHLNLDPAAEFDMFALIGHNFAEQANVEVRLDIADDAGHSVNNEALYGTGVVAVPTAERIVTYALTHNTGSRRYTGVTYARVLIKRDDAVNWLPEVGEVWIGRRRQLERKGREPYHDLGSVSDTADFRSQSGVIARHTRNKGRRKWPLRLNPSSTAGKADLVSFWKETEYGTRAFLFCDAPSTAPKRTRLFMAERSEVEFAAVGPHEREFEIEMLEQPVFYDVETAAYA